MLDTAINIERDQKPLSFKQGWVTFKNQDLEVKQVKHAFLLVLRV